MSSPAKHPKRQRTARLLKIGMWVFLGVVIWALAVLFWAHIAVVAIIVIPLLIILSVLRSALQDYRGRPRDYTAGTMRLSHLPSKPKEIRHFADQAGDDDGAAS